MIAWFVCSAMRSAGLERYAFRANAVALPVRERPDAEAVRRALEQWALKIREAGAAGDDDEVRLGRAMKERANRWMARLSEWSAGDTYLLAYTVMTVGDAVWVTVEGEPYITVQEALQRRFPDRFVIVLPLDRSINVAYLLPREKYGLGIYQEEPSLLGPGCLEMLIDAIGDRIDGMLGA